MMKKFLIIGNQNACTYKEVFPLFKEGKMTTGYSFNKCLTFKVPDWYEKAPYCKVPGVGWFSNLRVEKDNDLVLEKKYDPDFYKRYDNYDAINCDKVKDIPIDYEGPMGVPITVLKYLGNDGKIYLNEGYEIEGISSSSKLNAGGVIKKGSKTTKAKVEGKELYPRIMIQKADYSIKGIDRYIEDNPKPGERFSIDNKEKYGRVIIKKDDGWTFKNGSPKTEKPEVKPGSLT